MSDKAIRIQISPKDPVEKNIQNAVTFVEMDDKRFFLEETWSLLDIFSGLFCARWRKMPCPSRWRGNKVLNEPLVPFLWKVGKQPAGRFSRHTGKPEAVVEDATGCLIDDTVSMVKHISDLVYNYKFKDKLGLNGFSLAWDKSPWVNKKDKCAQ